MACISIGKIDKNMILIIVGCIINIVDKMLSKFDEIKLFDHIIICMFILSIVKTFNFIPYIFLKMRSKKVKLEKVNNSKSFVSSYVNKQKNMVAKYKYLYILLAASLFFIQSVIRVYTIKLKLNTWIVDIIIYCLFYYIIFKNKLYKHHYLSIVLIIIAGLILDLALTNIQNDLINNFPFVLLRLLGEILYSLHDVINKYIMEKKYCSVYELSAFSGLFMLFYTGTLSILNYYVLYIDDIGEYFSNFHII